MSQSLPPESLLGETLIRFVDLPKKLPKRHGKRVSLPTLYRWRNAGLAGVRLETAYHGGVLVTSEEALARFDQRVSAVKIAPVVMKITRSTDRQAAAAHNRAKKKLTPKKTKVARPRKRRNESDVEERTGVTRSPGSQGSPGRDR